MDLNNHLNTALRMMVVLLVLAGILMVVVTKRATERKVEEAEPKAPATVEAGKAP